MYRDVLFKAEFLADYSFLDRTLDLSYLPTVLDRDLARLTLRPYAGFFKNKGMVRFNAGVGLAYYDILRSPSDNRLAKSRLLYVEPEANLDLVFSQNHTLSLAVAEKGSTASSSIMNVDTVLSSYVGLQLPHRIGNPFHKTFRASVYYFNFSMYHTLTLLAKVNYSHTRGEIVSIHRHRGQQLEHYLISSPGVQQEVEASVNLTKGLGKYPFEMSFRPSYRYSIWDYYNASNTGKMYSHSVYPRVGLSSKFRDFPLISMLATAIRSTIGITLGRLRMI